MNWNYLATCLASGKLCAPLTWPTCSPWTIVSWWRGGPGDGLLTRKPGLRSPDSSPSRIRLSLSFGRGCTHPANFLGTRRSGSFSPSAKSALYREEDCSHLARTQEPSPGFVPGHLGFGWSGLASPPWGLRGDPAAFFLVPASCSLEQGSASLDPERTCFLPLFFLSPLISRICSHVMPRSTWPYWHWLSLQPHKMG